MEVIGKEGIVLNQRRKHVDERASERDKIWEQVFQKDGAYPSLEAFKLDGALSNSI